MFNVLLVCYNKLFKAGDSSDKCGFITINRKSVVPYIRYNQEQCVPLFYFENIEHLELKATLVEEWNLSYLRLCYKVQGIRDEYFKKESCAVATLKQIQECFPDGTSFQEYWPSNVELFSRFPNKNRSMVWFRLPTFQVVPNLSFLHRTPV